MKCRSDWVFKEWKFTNLSREQDRSMIYLREQADAGLILKGKSSSALPSVSQKSCVYRLMNKLETFKYPRRELRYCLTWHLSKLCQGDYGWEVHLYIRSPKHGLGQVKAGSLAMVKKSIFMSVHQNMVCNAHHQQPNQCISAILSYSDTKPPPQPLRPGTQIVCDQGTRSSRPES